MKGTKRSFKKRSSIFQKQSSSKKCKDSDDCQQKGRFTVTNKHLDENVIIFSIFLIIKLKGEPIEGDDLTNGGGGTPDSSELPCLKDKKMSRRQTIIDDIMQ
jgi:hypothetical protein